MAPGPLTSRNHGGHGFGPRFHGQGYGRIAPPPQRTYFPPQQRFSVAPNATGGTDIALTEDETVLIGTDPETGAVTISVNPKPTENGAENGNDVLPVNGRTHHSRGLAGRHVDKMAVSANSDGSVTIRPEGDAALQVVGDPMSGAVTVVEIIPEPWPPPSPKGHPCRSAGLRKSPR
jgi:hypothetical protein